LALISAIRLSDAAVTVPRVSFMPKLYDESIMAIRSPIVIALHNPRPFSFTVGIDILFDPTPPGTHFRLMHHPQSSQHHYLSSERPPILVNLSSQVWYLRVRVEALLPRATAIIPMHQHRATLGSYFELRQGPRTP
jgi:hypothetical protein